MLPIFVLSFLAIILSGITTIPFVIVLLAISTVILKRSWVFFVAFLLGLFFDLALIRPLGYTSLVLTVFVFLVFLYERKFETQTTTFVFVATFLGSLVYLNIFGYQQILLQSFVNSFLATLLFKFSIRNLKFEMKI